jgi:hypothetical protein
MENLAQYFSVVSLIIVVVFWFFFAWCFGRIAKKCKRSFWLYAIGTFIPLLNLILFFYLGFSKE